MTDLPVGDSKVIYRLEDRPPVGRVLVPGLQHTLAVFAATVSLPLLLGPGRLSAEARASGRSASRLPRAVLSVT